MASWFRSTLRAVPFLLTIGALAVACGGTTSTSTSTPPRATSAPGTAGATPPTSTGVAIADLCGLVGTTAVSAALGEPVTAGATETSSGSTSCTFAAPSGTEMALGVTTGFSSLSSWDFQMQTLGMTAANKVPGIGEAAYAKAGLPFGELGASFAAYQDHTGINVTIESSANPATLVAAATAIGKILFEAVL